MLRGASHMQLLHAKTQHSIGLLAAALVAGFISISKSSAAEKTRPNVVILLNDDQGWMDIACAGHPVIQTPAADRLAREGVRFTDMTAAFPVCSPSRAALLTGRDPNRFGMKHILNEGDKTSIPPFHQIPLEEPSLARLLKGVGYRTAHIGKWHVSLVERSHLGVATPTDYGFDHWMILGAGRTTSYFSSGWHLATGQTRTEGRWTAEVYVDEAIKFIEAGDGEPFFINLWSFSPHGEAQCSEEYMARYPDRTKQEQIYLGTITQQEDQYSRLLDYLDEKGLADNTIVIYSSDNGCDPHTIPWMENSRGNSGPFRGGKHNIYEAGIRVPGIVRWPGVAPAGLVVHQAVSLLDVMPTLCAAAGAEVPGGIPYDGADFRPALEGEPITRPHALYWQYEMARSLLPEGPEFASPQLAMRRGPWKLMCDLGWKRVELYNLDMDAAEKWNLATKHSDIADSMLEEMKAIYADINGDYARRAKFIHPAVDSPTYMNNYIGTPP